MTVPGDTSETQSAEALENLLAEYVALAESGSVVDVETLIARCPQHHWELREFIAMDRQFRVRSAAATKHRDPTILLDSRFSHSDPGVRRDAPALVGDYELQEEIDRGGMGVVFKARHTVLGRTVAIKMLLAGSFASEEAERRFQREAAAAARLSHPGIVAVYDVGVVHHPGVPHGQTWFAMAFVDGTDLARRIHRSLFEGRVAAALAIRIADAVHYAHEKGVIHRDLKPANILLDSNGVPRITDFGLSRCQDDGDTRLTADGQIFGTPGYMSPEQAAGRNEDVGPASDVYALGAVLYCMLTGRPPFRATSTIMTLQQVINDAPAPPRLLNRDVPPDLESIIMKCLEKQPQNRYTSALELKQDLERHLNGERVTAASINLVGYVGRVLASSRNSEFLAGWSRALYAVSAVVFVAHVLLQCLTLSATQITLLNAAKYSLLFGVVWRARRGILTPQNHIERVIWNLWIGYLLSFVAVEMMSRLPAGGSINLYAVMSLVSSVILLVLGGQLWGGCYLIGGCFLGLAPFLTQTPQFGPMLFGCLWSLVFLLLGRKYRRQSLEFNEFTSASPHAPAIRPPAPSDRR